MMEWSSAPATDSLAVTSLVEELEPGRVRGEHGEPMTCDCASVNLEGGGLEENLRDN